MITAMPNFITDNVANAAEFCRHHLGCDEVLRVPPDSPNHVVLRLGGSLLAFSSPAALRESGFHPIAENTTELVVFCSDVSAEVTRLLTEGAMIERAPFRHRSGHMRAYLNGPGGRLIALVDAPPH